MAVIRVVCVNPACQRTLRIRASQSGKQLRCPKCLTAMMAPTLADAAAAGCLEEDSERGTPRRGPPAWMAWLFYFGLFVGFFGILVVIAAFEVFLVVDSTPVNKGAAAKMLAGSTWRIDKVEGKVSPHSVGAALWCEKGFVWTFHDGARAETGRLVEGLNRYEREPSAGFREWQWRTNDDQLTLASKGEKPITFVVAARPKGLAALTPVEEEGAPSLVMAKAEPVETFPDLRVVFYGGVLAPMLFVLLLSWLISREVFYHGCLRFLLAWPLTVVLGLGLGAATGFLMDVLDEHSHIAEPYWMTLSLLQGMIAVATGFVLSVLSVLRPAW